MSQRSPKPCGHRGAAPHPRGADPGARWQTLCDTDRNVAGARDSLTPDHKSATAQFLSGFDEFAAGSEALVLRSSERTNTARGIRQLCFFKNAALGDQSFETRQTKSACDRDAQPMRPATTSTTLF